MPQWIHGRAEHILASNPSMPKSEAFAIATQQSHAVGKSPRGYGTAEGRHAAKAKYRTPGDDRKAANPGQLDSPKMAAVSYDAFLDELLKQADLADFARKLKDVALTELPGTKPWLIPSAQPARAKQLGGVVRRAVSSKPAWPSSTAKVHMGKLAEINQQRLHPTAPTVPLAKPPNPSFAIKQGFAVSAFSGHMSEGAFPQASSIPAWKQPTLKQAGPPGDSRLEATDDGVAPDGRAHLKKSANVSSPAGQLAKTTQVGAPKLTMPGPSIAQQAKPRGFGTAMPGLTKQI